MGYVGVSICDMCGKRTEKFAGKMVLFGYQKRLQGYTSQYTVRSWSLCKRCSNKLSATETVGDKIREDIELKLDQLRVENKEITLLE